MAEITADRAPAPETAPSSMLLPWVTRLVVWNSDRVRRTEPDTPNPRPIEESDWCQSLAAEHPTIREEWDAFAAGGGRLPVMEDLMGSWQGNVGTWRGGPLIRRRRPQPPFADLFPQTVAALLAVPGLLHASWSVFDAGTELPVHNGPNAGCHNILMGVHCPPGSGHEIEGQPLSLAGGRVILFDDTLPHAAWNRSDEPRVVLHGEMLRRVPGVTGIVNNAVQWATYWLTPSLRDAARNGAELHRALNE